MNWRRRLACWIGGAHVDTTEQYEIEPPFSGRVVYHAEIRNRRRCLQCGRTEDVSL